MKTLYLIRHAKSSKDDRHVVELEIWAENQRGEKVVTGKATVALPARES